MSIQVGHSLPAGKLAEYVLIEGQGCAIGPNAVDIAEATAGKTIAIFGVPGAFTPTCQKSHLPGYRDQYDAFRAAGVDEIWCFAVNDAFVMGAWGQHMDVEGRLRMMADGDATYTRALGLELDLTGKGLGLRCQRFSMLVRDGVVTHLHVEEGGKLETSDATTLLADAKSLS